MWVILFAREDYRSCSLRNLLSAIVNDPGNGEAWREFFRRFDKPIHNMIAAGFYKYRNSCSDGEACDLAQQIYSRLLENNCRALRNFRGVQEADFRAYLAKICYNLLHDRWREHADAVPLIDGNDFSEGGSLLSGFQPAVDPDQERAVQRREIRDLVQTSLSQIGNGAQGRRDCLVFLLRCYDGYSAEEVAKALNITANHVHTICHRVRKKVESDLAKALGKKNVGFDKLM